jgi:hypothetical protein
MQNLDALYQVVAQGGRDDWFRRVRGAARSNVWTVLGTSAGDGARGQPPAVQLTISPRSGAVNFSSRAASALGGGLRDAQENGRRFVWVPLLLNGGREPHANGLWVDLEAREVWVFEPHGSDPAAAGQRACGFHNFYGRASYEAAMRRLVDDATKAAWGLVGVLAVYLPSDYLPPVWGQSLSDVRGRALGDRWCAAWCLLFFDAATRFGPTAIVDEWGGDDVGAHLIEAMRNHARWMRVHPQYLK